MPALDLDLYFARIGYSGPSIATLPTLRELHALHPAAIVFENLDVLLKRPIQLDVETLVRKLIYHGRGGYCYDAHSTVKCNGQILALKKISRGVW